MSPTSPRSLALCALPCCLAVAGSCSPSEDRDPAARSAVAREDSTDTITVRGGNGYYFHGWGTSLAWWANVYGGPSFSDASRALVEDALFGRITDDNAHLGLNVIRYNIGASPASPACPQLAPAKRLVSVVQGPDHEVDLGLDAKQLQILTEADSVFSSAGVWSVYEVFANSPP